MEPVIKYKGTLKNLKLQNILIQQIQSELRGSFPKIEDVKLNLDLVLQICKAIENNSKVNGLKDVDKLDLFFKVYEITFGRLDERDKAYLTSMIEYLHKNKMIKSTKLIVRVARTLMRFFLRK